VKEVEVMVGKDMEEQMAWLLGEVGDDE